MANVYFSGTSYLPVHEWEFLASAGTSIGHFILFLFVGSLFCLVLRLGVESESATSKLKGPWPRMHHSLFSFA